MTEFAKIVIEIIQNIPRGKVLTYGSVSSLAGIPRGARQVSRILHSCSIKYNLPWHRVINSKGEISLGKNGGYEIQRKLLISEGIKFENERLDLKEYLWEPDLDFLNLDSILEDFEK